MFDAGRLRGIYDTLFDAYGPQHWWPGDTPFEIMVGAVLTQNTAWSNVERAIANLHEAGCMNARAIVDCGHDELAERLRPSGYFNIKAKRLRAFCQWLIDSGGESTLALRPLDQLRTDLLAVHGVGPETADDILLYAFERPVFVIDAYTRRIFARLGLLIDPAVSYEHLRQAFETALEPDVDMFNEYHALIVRHAKVACAKRPRCDQCVLRRQCPGREDKVQEGCL